MAGGAALLFMVGAAWTVPADAVGGGAAGPPEARLSLSRPDGRAVAGLQPVGVALIGMAGAVGLLLATRSGRRRNREVRRFRAQLEYPLALSLFVQVNPTAPRSPVSRRPQPTDSHPGS